MRIFSFAIVLAAVATASVSLAATPEGRLAAPSPKPDEQAPAVVEPPTMDELFDKLKTAKTAGAARRIASDIEQRFADTGSDTVNYLIMQATAAMKANKTAIALDLLDAAIALKPDAAEAWNRRAAVHYARKEFDQAIEDVDVTLRLEPRHWGAMSGLVSMLADMDRKKEALALLRRLQEIYPLLPEIDKKIEALSLDIDGRKA